MTVEDFFEQHDNKETQLINKYFNAVPHKYTSRKLAKQLAVIAQAYSDHENKDLKATLAYLYQCYLDGSHLLDHVEDEIKRITMKPK